MLSVTKSSRFFCPFCVNGMKNNRQIQNKSREQLRKLVMLSLFTAVAYLSMYIVNFKVAFLTFDIKNVFITVAAMIYGPLEGVIVSLLAALLELPSSSTGFYGFIMNFISSASFSVIASLIYRMKRTPAFSYISLAAATLGSTAFMMIANLFITPYYMGGTMSEVAALIPKLLFPFNLIKCLVNAGGVLIFYKPISMVLRRGGILKKEGGEGRYLSLRTGLTVLIALVMIVLSLVIFFLILGGNVDMGK